MGKKIMYELFYTDAWATRSTLNVDSRILLTSNIEILGQIAYDIIMNDLASFELENDIEELGIEDAFDVIEAIQNGAIKYLFINTVEVDEVFI